MKLLKPLAIIVLLFMNQQIVAQDFYETSWSSSGYTYKALLVYYSNSDAYMRVNYKKNNRENIIHYDCTWKSFEQDGLKGYLLDGENAKVIYGSSTTGYFPDNFFFSNNSLDGKPYHFDDYDITKGSLLTKLGDVSYWRKVYSSKLTTDYLLSYFDTGEYKYSSIKKSIAAGNTTTTTNSTLKTTSTTSTTLPTKKWACIFSKSTGYTTQKYLRSTEFPSTDIKKYWDLSYDITDLSYHDNKWVLVMSKNSNLGLQRWKTRTYFPKTEIEEGWDDGYFITNLAYGDGVWALVMSKTKKYTKQKWITHKTFPKDNVQNSWDDSYSITSVSYGDSKWAVVMSKGSGITTQIWRTRYEYPKKSISEYWDLDYDISNLTYGNGVWLLVMSKNSKSSTSTERWNTTAVFPYDKISKAKKDGYKIVTITANQ